MAIVGSRTYLKYFTVFIDYTIAQSIPANTSTIRARIGFTAGVYGAITVNQRDCSVTVAGTTKTVAMPSANSDFNSSNTFYSSWAEFSVPHNSDGTKTISMSGVYNVQATINGTYYGSWGTNSASVTLPKIPRGSVLTGVNSITTDSTGLTVKIDKKLSSAYHYINLYIGSTRITGWSNYHSGGTVTLPLSLEDRRKMLAVMPSSTSGTISVGLFTYPTSSLSGEMIGTPSRKTATVTVASSERPSITDTGYNSYTRFNLSGKTLSPLVQNVGRVNFEFRASASYGTSIKTALSTFCGNSSSANPGSFTPSRSGRQSLVSKATDKRGRTTTKTANFTVLPYSQPELRLVYVGRPRDSNTEKHYIQVEINTKVASVMQDSTELNRYQVIIQTREVGASSWDTVLTETYTATGQATRTYTPSQIYDETKSFDVRVLLQDEFRTVTAVSKVGTANYLMALGKHGVGVGKLPEGRRVLDVGGDIWDRMDRNLSDTVSDLTSLIDITGDFTLSEGVTSLYAYKLGHLRFLKFEYQPTKTGFTQNVITTSKHKPRLHTSVTVSTRYSTTDSARGISSYFDSDGQLTVVTPEVPSYPMLFSCMYFA